MWGLHLPDGLVKHLRSLACAGYMNNMMQRVMLYRIRPTQLAAKSLALTQT
jgi:hypothetical protein